MEILQLNPPIPLSTPKGKGLAWLIIDYGGEYNLFWVVAIDATGEVWTFDNSQVRATKNITLGRFPNNPVFNPQKPKKKLTEEVEE